MEKTKRKGIEMEDIKDLIYTDKYNDSVVKIAFYCALTWIITPILIMILNLTPLDEITVACLWSMIMSIIGGLGIGLGVVFLSNRICKINNKSLRSVAFDLLPLLALVLFLIWAFICSLLAKNKYEAFMGTWRREGWLAYVSYSGYLFIGLILSSNKYYVKKIAHVLIITASILSTISLLDNNLTQRMCYSQYYTSTPHYQSVFFNTNHFAYYLLIALLVTFFLYMCEKNRKKQLAYMMVYFLLFTMLIVNDTLGDYLAFFVTLLFVLIWKFINKETEKTKVSVYILLFVIFSVVSLLYTPNVYSNFKSVFGDLDLLEAFFAGRAQEDDIASIGTSRGILWTNGLHFIADSPIFGYGIENTYDLYFSVGSTINRPHNIFIQMGLFTGIPGLLLYVSAFVIGGVRLVKVRKSVTKISKAAAFIVVGYMMSAFFGNSMFYTSPYFMLVFGLCASNCLRNLNITNQKVLGEIK